MVSLSLLAEEIHLFWLRGCNLLSAAALQLLVGVCTLLWELKIYNVSGSDSEYVLIF